MRALAWLITVPLFLVLLVFTLANRHEVTLSFWPFGYEMSWPLSIFIIGFLFFGIILGNFIAWVRSWPEKIRCKSLQNDLAEANRQIARLRAEMPAKSPATYDDILFDQPTNQLTRI